jgi:hypothetical protein
MIISELFETPQMCPECGGISFSDLILAEKKDACYYKVKASAKVWPSAYASGRLVQCRKKGAGNYGNKSEGVMEMDKSQTPPGRDGSNDPNAGKKEYTAKTITPKTAAKDAVKILNKVFNKKKGVAEGQLEMNTPDPVVVVQDLKGKILDKLNLSVAAQKYKLGQPQNIKNQLAHQNYTKVGNYTIVSPMSGQPQDATTQGMAEGEQQKGADYRDPKEVDYDDNYDAMVARVKKLAGLGPMRTVYDPAKRVYKNVPVAVQPKK